MTDDGRDRFRCPTPTATIRRRLRMVAGSDQEVANGLGPPASGLSESAAERRALLQCRRLEVATV
jgi:hypothetical protein